MTRGAAARLFVAVDPPDEVREELLAWGRKAVAACAHTRRGEGAGPELRLLEPAALHLTVCFLGARPVGEIDVIGSTLAGCAREVGELSLGAPLWLPPRRPGVLAVEVHDRDGGLTALHRQVSGALADAIGWQPERRRFRGHITVARARGRGRMRRRSAHRQRGSGDAAGARPAGEQSSTALPATPPLRFTPGAVLLYQSRLGASGASYEALAECELAGAAL